MRTGQRYEHVISLGSFCSVAQEIGRYGLRDASYPFDWTICSLVAVLDALSSDFERFHDVGRLARLADAPAVVRDSVGIEYYHDYTAEKSIEEQFPDVRTKYQRRIERFRAAMLRPTLFIRWVSSSGEADYIERHYTEIIDLLQVAEGRNGLMLVGLTSLPSECAGQQVFRVDPDEGDTVARRFAEKSPDIHRVLMGVRYPIAKRFGNLIYHYRNGR